MQAKFVASESHEIKRIASTEATDIITDILSDNEARRKSFGTNSPLAFEERVAAKTGASSGFRDAWTVGYDREHTVAIWAGNFDGRPMRDTLAVRSAAPLWASVMHELLRNDHPAQSAECRPRAPGDLRNDRVAAVAVQRREDDRAFFERD
jgi:penicillin-binding protein 1C